MSSLDQPILIANSNYHVGHQMAIFVDVDIDSERTLVNRRLEIDSGRNINAVPSLRHPLELCWRLKRNTEF